MEEIKKQLKRFSIMTILFLLLFFDYYYPIIGNEPIISRIPDSITFLIPGYDGSTNYNYVPNNPESYKTESSIKIITYIYSGGMKDSKFNTAFILYNNKTRDIRISDISIDSCTYMKFRKSENNNQGIININKKIELERILALKEGKYQKIDIYIDYFDLLNVEFTRDDHDSYIYMCNFSLYEQDEIIFSGESNQFSNNRYTQQLYYTKAIAENLI